MTESYWVRNSVDFEYFNKAEPSDIVKIKNSDNLETEFFCYSRNFHDAADQIMEYLETTAATNKDIGKLDTWFFAVIYLYRQSLELLLKAIILKRITDQKERIKKLYEVSHDLKKCFDIIVKDLNIDKTHQTLINLNWLGEYLGNISSVDRESDMFRYPFNHNMQAMFEEQTHVNLLFVKQNLNAAYNILSDLLAKDFSRNYKLLTPKLIITGGNYYEQSVVGYKFSQKDYYPYIKGYEESANFLRATILRDTNLSMLFLPMCYLYRNAVELGLKRILVEDCKIPRKKALAIIRGKKHSVLGLWRKIKEHEIEKHANAPDGDTTLIDAAKYIDQLHNIDSDSTKFRYPVNMNLQFHFRKEKKYSIVNIATCFNELIEFLDSVDTMLSEIREWEAEMEAEMRNDFLADNNE